MREGIYPRASKAVGCYVWAATRRERAAWRGLRQRILTGDLDAADESSLTWSHRHSALWDAS